MLCRVVMIFTQLYRARLAPTCWRPWSNLAPALLCRDTRVAGHRAALSRAHARCDEFLSTMNGDLFIFVS